MLQYLTLLSQSGIAPNFWTSQAYLERAGATECVKGDLVWLEADGVPLFPALSFSGTVAPPCCWYVPYCWSDFAGVSFPDTPKELLDYEYLYDPGAFETMSGGKWATFRKNCRKFPTRNPESVYGRTTEPSPEELVALLQRWASRFDEDATIHDFSVILRYIEDVKHDANFGWKTLRLKDGLLVGINIWDRSWKYINFRYCFCDQDYPFISEYMRWLFYTDPAITAQKRLVCDGGVVDRPELKAFKEKMNPLQVREVYSWGIEPKGEPDGD
ncbi:MAG: hypothetical protein EOM17_13140 [Synergistales bacterium]|nr:hypothetical protein [Synergistales bacterium]